ncbi:MAG TPA: serine/threonine-protein kinase, partial [Pirellulaceae bacterium]|nr:serine/threonine-protein kinase [Pirellulaceae bacterium]
MLTRSGTVKILDLGLAHISKESDQTAELTSTGQIMGTFDYLAPEQATDTKNIDVRADIYSLGCTLFKLLTGRVPYASEQPRTSYQRIRAHLEEPIPSIAAIRADVPPELESLLMRMLAKQPAERFQSPEELKQQLANLSAGHDLPALITAAATSSNAEVDTASMGGTTFTLASGIAPAEDSEPKEPNTPQHASSITPVATNVTTPAGRTPRPSLLSLLDGRGVRPTLVAVILLTLLALPIAYFSGLLFTVKTAGGTIVLECDPAALKDAKIEIDGEQVQLKLAGDDQAVTIGVDQRRGKLKITKAGFKVFDTNFEIAVGDNEHAITVRLEPLPDAADRVAAATAWKPGPTDDVIPGLIPRPATFPGIKRWQIETKLPRTIIRCGAYSPDGKRLACGTEAGHVRIYDAETLQLVDLITDHTEHIHSVAWSPDGQWFAFGGGEFAIQLRHIADQRSLSIPIENTGHVPVNSISWEPESTRFAVARGFAVEVFDITGRRTSSLPAPGVRVVAWSPDGETLAGGDVDGKIRQWNGNDLVPGQVSDSEEQISCISWSADGERFATGHVTSGTVRLWKKDGTPIQTIDTGDTKSVSLAWNRTGNVLISGGNR